MSKRKAPASRSAEPSPKRQKVAIDDVDVTTEEGLNKLTVVDLRTLLKQKDLSTAGKKPELVARLVAAKDAPIVAANGEEAAPAANGEGEEAPKEADAVVAEEAAVEAPAAVAAVEEAPAAAVEEAAAPAAVVEEAVAAPAEAEVAPVEAAPAEAAAEAPVAE